MSQILEKNMALWKHKQNKKNIYLIIDMANIRLHTVGKWKVQRNQNTAVHRKSHLYIKKF